MKNESMKSLSLWRRFLLAGVSLAAATAPWLSTVHVFFQPNDGTYRQQQGIPSLARELAARHLALWEDAAARERELARMRTTNAEWDFMGRTFFVMALADMSLREPEQKARYLAV